MIRSYAWSGAGAIDQVEVSVDGGETWHSAHIEQPRDRFMWGALVVPLGCVSAGQVHADVAGHRRGRARAIPRTAIQQHAQELQRDCGPCGHGSLTAGLQSNRQGRHSLKLVRKMLLPEWRE